MVTVTVLAAWRKTCCTKSESGKRWLLLGRGMTQFIPIYHANSVIYTPWKLNIETEKGDFPVEISFSRGPFSGSIFASGGVFPKLSSSKHQKICNFKRRFPSFLPQKPSTKKNIKRTFSRNPQKWLWPKLWGSVLQVKHQKRKNRQLTGRKPSPDSSKSQSNEFSSFPLKFSKVLLFVKGARREMICDEQ